MSVPSLETASLVNERSPRIARKALGRVVLFPHQRAMVERMRCLESSVGGYAREDGLRVSSTVGVLCDEVGTGKSYTVLALIAESPILQNERDVPIRSSRIASSSSSSSADAFLHVWKREVVRPAERNLLVVPHGGVFQQWRSYIEASGLQAEFFDRPSALASSPDGEGVLRAPIALVSSTTFKAFHRRYCGAAAAETAVFSRVVVDEADSINVSSMPHVRASMYWLVTSSWRNLVYSSGIVPLISSSDNNNNPQRVQYMACDGVQRTGMVRDICRHVLHHLPTSRHVLLACDPGFVRSSFELIEPRYVELVCRAPAEALPGLIRGLRLSQEIDSMINAGDVEGAVARLGCGTVTDAGSLAGALTSNMHLRMRERNARLRYVQQVYGENDPRAAGILAEIDEIQLQIESVERRCARRAEENMCPVCYDAPGTHGPVCATRCCAAVFCLNCLQRAVYTTGERCVMCRASLSLVSDVVAIAAAGAMATGGAASGGDDNGNNGGMTSKRETLVRLVTAEHPNGRFLLFSMHDRTFDNVRPAFVRENVSHDRLCGNSSQIAHKLRRFERGELRVLMLNANHFGQGYNLQSATHVVMYHRMSQEISKQIVGRAQRLGRQGQLVVYSLLHPTEVPAEVHP